MDGIETEHRDSIVQNAEYKDTALDAAAKGQGVSGFEKLTLWQTMKAFKVCTATCALVAFSAATDGYQIGCVA